MPDKVIPHPELVEMFIKDIRAAGHAIAKNSKTSTHYKKIALMNNVMRALLINYPQRYNYLLETQTSLYHHIIGAGAHVGGLFYSLAAKIAIWTAIGFYIELLRNIEEDMLEKTLHFITSQENTTAAVYDPSNQNKSARLQYREVATA